LRGGGKRKKEKKCEEIKTKFMLRLVAAIFFWGRRHGLSCCQPERKKRVARNCGLSCRFLNERFV